MNKNSSFSNKVAIVTGSSQGIGKAIAIALAKEGAYIVLNGRNQERLSEAETELKVYTSNVISICADVSSIPGSQELIDNTIKRFNKIDILINNVGVSMRGSISELNPEVFKTVFESNVLGSVNPTIHALQYIRKTKGSIVFISSLAGIRGLPYLSAYSSSKLAIRALAESLRVEEAENNIHVGLVLVGKTDIAHNKQTINHDGKLIPLASRDKNKVLSLDFVARSVLKNISKRKFITIQTTLGKINAFLHARFPLLVEKIIISNRDKFKNEH